jgi:hypothetical protein
MPGYLTNLEFIRTLNLLERVPEEMFLVLSGLTSCDCDRGQKFWNDLWAKIVNLEKVSNEIKKSMMEDLLHNAYQFRAHMSMCETELEDEAECVSIELVSVDQAKVVAGLVSMNLLALFTLNIVKLELHEIFFAEYLHRLVHGVDCSVCREKMGRGLDRQPVQLPCKHLICDICKESMIEHQLYKCPLCRETFHEPDNVLNCSLSSVSDDDTEILERFLIVDEPL